MTESTLVEHALIEQLLEALRELPDVRAELARSEPAVQAEGRIDAKIDLHVAGQSIVLLLEAKKSVYPRDVRQALWQLKSLQHGCYADVQHLLIAESLSPGAKELLRAERIGYFDSGGSLFLPAAGAYIYIDKPAPKTLEKSVRSLFSGRRAQVLYALLVNHEAWFGVTEVAERAQVAPSTASDVLSELERFDWLVSRGQGPSKERQLREPCALLDAWAKQLATQRAPVLRRYFVPGLKSDALIERLGQLFDAHQVACAVRAAPRNWPSTCARKGLDSDAKTRNLRWLQRPVHGGLRTHPRHTAARTRTVESVGLPDREPEQREARMLRQRQACDVIEQLFARIGKEH